MKYIARNDDDKNGLILLHVPHHIMANSSDAASDAYAAVFNDNNLKIYEFIYIPNCLLIANISFYILQYNSNTSLGISKLTVHHNRSTNK